MFEASPKDDVQFQMFYTMLIKPSGHPWSLLPETNEHARFTSVIIVQMSWRELTFKSWILSAARSLLDKINRHRWEGYGSAACLKSCQPDWEWWLPWICVLKSVRAQVWSFGAVIFNKVPSFISGSLCCMAGTGELACFWFSTRIRVAN